MPAHYYIVTGDTREGPFDSISLLRKVRKGELALETQVSTNNYDAPIKAGDVAELAALFETEAAQLGDAGLLCAVPAISLGQLVKAGANGFIAHQSVTVLFSALAVMVAAVAILLSTFLGVLITLPIIAPIALCSVMLLSIMALRHARSRPMGVEQFNMILGRNLLACLSISAIPALLCLSIPLFLAAEVATPLSILSLLLSPILAIHSFAACYLSDHPEISAREAMKRSREAVKMAGTPSLIALSILWALIILTFSSIILGLIFIPIAMLGLADYYEDHLAN